MSTPLEETRSKTPLRDKQMPKDKGKWHYRAGIEYETEYGSIGETEKIQTPKIQNT